MVVEVAGLEALIPSGVGRRWPWTADPDGDDVVASMTPAAGLPVAGCALVSIG